MPMLAALFYLQFHSIKNRLWMRLRRLKKPKYLLGALVGGLYFYFYFFRWLYLGRGGSGGIAAGNSSESLALYQCIGAFILFVMVLLSWLLPKERAALVFTEAEVAFLFPAPVSRQGLIHYKLLRSQVAILFTTLFLTLISARAATGSHAWIRIAGWWLILSTLNLHLLGASFARTLLLDRGVSNARRRTTILFLLALTAGATILWARRTMPMPRLEAFQDLGTLLSYARQLLDSGPVPFLLYPFRLVVRPYLAQDARSFLLAAWPVLGLLALHYWWVIRSNVAFEEASVELARKIADRITAARAGQWQPGQKAKQSKRAPFELRPTGWPAVALLWKNLIAAGRFFTVRFWLLLLWILLVSSSVIGSTASDSGLLPAVGLLCLMLLGMSLLLGPQLVRQDFRQDFPYADILKMYPIPSWQMALGELLAPAMILTGIQWCLLVLLVGLCSRVSSETVVPLSVRLSLGLGGAILCPMLNLISLLIPNLAVLLFPSWFTTGKEGPQGIEATGQRLISVVAQLFVFVAALIPPSFSFTLIFLMFRYVSGWVAAVPPAALVAAVALGVEAGLGLWLLGRLFERLDLTAESTN